MSRSPSLFRRSRETLLLCRSTAFDTEDYATLRESKTMSSPRRSKRKCKSDYASPDGRPRIEVQNTLQDLKSIGPIRTLPNASVSIKLLKLIFDRMNTHIWYRILPLDSMKCDDFAFSCGQSWDLIKPLLFHLGYLLDVGGQLKCFSK